MKVCPSKRLVQEAISNDLGIDVSSLQELQLSLARGANGSNCSALGPFKCAEFIELAIRSQTLISVDSLSEFEDVKRIAKETGICARVVMRWHGEQTQTRFGMGMGELKRCVQLSHRTKYIAFEGFSFHLGGYDALARANALAQLIVLSRALLDEGIKVKTINIGGGLPVSYVSTSHDEQYVGKLSPSNFKHGKIVEDYYPYWGKHRASDVLKTILDHHNNALLSLLSWE